MMDTLLQFSTTTTTKKTDWLLIVPLKYLVHHFSPLLISAVAIVSWYESVFVCCLLCDRACMWGECTRVNQPATTGERQPVCFWIVSPFSVPVFPSPFGTWLPPFCRSLCEICSLLICYMNPPWIAAVVSSSLIDSNPSFFLSLSHSASALATSAPTPVVPPPLSLSIPRWEYRNRKWAAGQPADRRESTGYKWSLVVIVKW